MPLTLRPPLTTPQHPPTMADNVYQPGDLVPLEATFRNAAGTPTNSTVVLRVKDPAGTVTTPTPTNTGPGVYHYDLPVATAGLWWYAFEGTGPVTATEENSFYVEARETLAPRLSARALVTLADARRWALRDITDDSNDDYLIDLVETYSEMVYGYTRREWMPLTAAATRRFRYPGYGLLHLSPYDLRAATQVVTYTEWPTAYQVTLAAGTATVDPEYLFRPYGADPNTGTYRWVELQPSAYAAWAGSAPFEVSVTGSWGVGTIPRDVKSAVLIAVGDAYHNPEGSPARTFGALTVTEDFETGDAARWRALPGESRALLERFRDDPALVLA